MSEIKVNSIKGVGASAAAITVNNTDGTCTANLTNRTNKNLVVNGACLIAQRGVSSTSQGYTCDRFHILFAGEDESPTHAQVDVASGTTPYTNGFRKALKITNGNQTSGAGSSDYIIARYKIEGQDVANSGWNYISSTSFITLSFWIKSSVAQNFYFNLISTDGTAQNYAYETGSLSANTWTKVTKTIPGASNVQIDNNNGLGLQLDFWAFAGTAYTDGGVTLNQWGAYSSGGRMPDHTSTWYTTNDATLEITGVQLEVGSVATDFEHRSFAQELALCQRYYYRHAQGAAGRNIGICAIYQANDIFPVVHFPCTMRTTPSLDVSDSSGYFRVYSNGGSDAFDTFSSLWNTGDNAVGLNAHSSDGVSGRTAGHAAMVITDNSSAHVSFSAEL